MTRLLALILLAPLAPAAEIVVDDGGGPGVDFTNIQVAIDAARPGDVLLVAPGDYDAFTLDKPLSVVGSSAPFQVVDVAGTSVVTGVPAGQVAALRNLFLGSLHVDGNRGTVVGDVLLLIPPQEIQGPGDDFALKVRDSVDVRMRQLGINPANGSGRNGVLVENSMFSCDGGALDGARGVAGAPGSPEGGPGGVGVRVGAGADVHIVFSRTRGGDGGAALFAPEDSFVGGDGAPAVVVEAGGALRYDGSEIPATEILGGRGGDGSDGLFGGCALDGAHGVGVLVEDGGVARVSSKVVVEGGANECGDGGPFAGDGDLSDAVEPSLHWSGAIDAVGLDSTITMNDLPGAQMLLVVGTDPLLLPSQKFGGPLLVAPLFSVLPPVVANPSGEIDLPGTLPEDTPPGLNVMIQAITRRVDASLHISNPAGLVGPWDGALP